MSVAVNSSLVLSRNVANTRSRTNFCKENVRVQRVAASVKTTRAARALRSSTSMPSVAQFKASRPLRASSRVNVLTTSSNDSVDYLQNLGTETRELLAGSSIFLVGMMGSGKSSLSAILASALKYTPFDSDGVIEQLTNKSVAELWAEDGEETFRALETQVLQELCSYTKAVVATGGGTVSTRANWMHMRSGIVVYLDYPADVLAGRVIADGSAAERPMLKEFADDESRVTAHLQGLMEERASMYAQSDVMVPFHDSAASTMDVEACAARILTQLKKRLSDDAQQEKLRTVPTDVQVDGTKEDDSIN